MNKKTAAFLVPVMFGMLAASGCSMYNLERKLSPKYSEFYAKTEYIFTNQERKDFLNRPDSEKDAFIEEFWKKRDPNPETDINEFKIEYEKRVAQADKLFFGEGRSGWSTDRGRIYILFGPPTERQTYNVDSSGYCRELWYYGTFPVIFIDRGCTGRYELTAINLEHLSDLNMAQNNFRSGSLQLQEKNVLDYDLVLVKIAADDKKYEGKLVISIPYSSIGFDFKAGRLETSFEVRAAAYDAKKMVVWQDSATFPLSLDKEQLKAAGNKPYVIEVPIALSSELKGADWSEVTIEVNVRNTTEKSGQQKVLKMMPKS